MQCPIYRDWLSCNKGNVLVIVVHKLCRCLCFLYVVVKFFQKWLGDVKAKRYFSNLSPLL